MSFLPSFRVCIVAALIGLAAPTLLHAQKANMQSSVDSDMALAYNAAIAAFQKGDWAAAATGLEQVIAMVMLPTPRKRTCPCV